MNEGHWSSVYSKDGSVPIKRQEASLIGVENKLYLFGGRGIKKMSIYDLKNQKWSVGAETPIELHHFQPVVYKNEIYIIGAMTGGYPGETPVEEIYVYNPMKDEWRIEGKIPSERARGSAGVVVDGDLLYLVCGIKDGHRGDHKNWLDQYNFVTKQWTQLPNAPRARDHFQAALVNGAIYSLAGRTTLSEDNPFKHTIGQVDVYDIDKQVWSTLEQDLPTWRAGNAILSIGKEIFILGGESFTQNTAHAEFEVLNTDTKKWTSLPPIPVGRHGTGLVHWKGSMYTSSGSGNRGGGPELEDLWQFVY